MAVSSKFLFAKDLATANVPPAFFSQEGLTTKIRYYGVVLNVSTKASWEGRVGRRRSAFCGPRRAAGQGTRMRNCPRMPHPPSPRHPPPQGLRRTGQQAVEDADTANCLEQEPTEITENGKKNSLLPLFSPV